MTLNPQVVRNANIDPLTQDRILESFGACGCWTSPTRLYMCESHSSYDLGVEHLRRLIAGARA